MSGAHIDVDVQAVSVDASKCTATFEGFTVEVTCCGPLVCANGTIGCMNCGTMLSHENTMAATVNAVEQVTTQLLQQAGVVRRKVPCPHCQEVTLLPSPPPDTPSAFALHYDCPACSQAVVTTAEAVRGCEAT